jgi:hypothetical protein
MNRSIDVRTEMRKLADSKPMHAAAGAGVLASETLRELSARLANWRPEASVNALSTRANGYVTTARTRAATEYDKLAKRGVEALHARGNGHAKGALNAKQSHRTQPRSTKA